MRGSDAGSINLEFLKEILENSYHMDVHENLSRVCDQVMLKPARLKVIKLFSCSTQLSTKFILIINVRERSGSVVECLTRDRRAAG